MVDPQVAMGLNTTVCSDLDDLEYQNDGIMYPIHFHQCFQFEIYHHSKLFPIYCQWQETMKKIPGNPRPVEIYSLPEIFHQTMAAPLSSLALLGL